MGMGMLQSEREAILNLVAKTFGTDDSTYQEQFGLVIFERMLNENPQSRRVFLSYGIPQDPSCPITIPMLKENKKMQVRIPRQFKAMREMLILIGDEELFYKTGVKMGKVHARLALQLDHLQTLQQVVLDVLCESYGLVHGSNTYLALEEILNKMTDSMNEGMVTLRLNSKTIQQTT